MKPGVALRELYDFGRDEMKKAGYLTDKAAMPSKDLGSGIVTIHGIGLGPMHDPPHVDDRDIKLETGMTVAVTSGARFADFTIRFEDDVVLVPGGVELINTELPWGL